HDVVVQSRERELVIGTHGRSIYVLDVAPLQELNAKTLAAPAHLFEPVPVTEFLPRPARDLPPKNLTLPNPPYGVAIHYHLKDKVETPVRVRITDGKGEVVMDLIGAGTPGLQQVQWNLRRGAGAEAPLVPAGEYDVTLETGKARVTKRLKIDTDDRA